MEHQQNAERTHPRLLTACNQGASPQNAHDKQQTKRNTRSRELQLDRSNHSHSPNPAANQAVPIHTRRSQVPHRQHQARHTIRGQQARRTHAQTHNTALQNSPLAPAIPQRHTKPRHTLSQEHTTKAHRPPHHNIYGRRLCKQHQPQVTNRHRPHRIGITDKLVQQQTAYFCEVHLRIRVHGSIRCRPTNAMAPPTTPRLHICNNKSIQSTHRQHRHHANS